jgi:hypothetical protein
MTPIPNGWKRLNRRYFEYIQVAKSIESVTACAFKVHALSAKRVVMAVSLSRSKKEPAKRASVYIIMRPFTNGAILSDFANKLWNKITFPNGLYDRKKCRLETELRETVLVVFVHMRRQQAQQPSQRSASTHTAVPTNNVHSPSKQTRNTHTHTQASKHCNENAQSKEQSN